MGNLDERSRIVVRSVAAQTSRRLATRYRADIGILIAQRSELAGAPFGINIDEVVILDIDAGGHLLAIEVLRSRRNWKVKPNLLRMWDRVAPPKDLEVLELTETSRQLNEHVEIMTSEDRSIVHVELRLAEASLQQVSLGPDCQALIAKDVLIGFLFRLT